MDLFLCETRPSVVMTSLGNLISSRLIWQKKTTFYQTNVANGLVYLSPNDITYDIGTLIPRLPQNGIRPVPNSVE